MDEQTQIIRADRNVLELALRAAGCTFRGKACTCPFHEDKHASGSIFQAQDGHWMFKCFTPACGFSGDIFDVRAKLQNRSLGDVLKEAAAPVVAKEVRDKPKRVFPSVTALESSVASMGEVESSYKYVNPDTGVPDAVQVRYVPRGEDRKKFLTHHPVEGGFALGAPPKPWPLYNRTRLRSADKVILVEGEKCVHALANHEIVATTSLSGAGNADKADWTPMAGKTVYCWRDNDESGEKYIRTAISLMEQLTPRPTIYALDVTTLGLPEGGDVVDYLDKNGIEGFWDMMRDGSEQVGEGSQVKNRFSDIISGKWHSIPWPWKRLSEYSKSLFPGTITMLCGEPSATKSLFLVQAAEWWNRMDVKVAMLELELGKATHLQRTMAMLAGNWDVLDDVWGKANPDALMALYAKHKAQLDAFEPCVFEPTSKSITYPHTLKWIEERCIAGAEIIVVDPVTAIDAGESSYAADRKFVSNVSEMISDYHARLILVTHPRGGTKGRMGLDDIAGARAFTRHTQCVLIISRVHPAKEFICRTEMGQGNMECNRRLQIAKATYGKGTGCGIGLHLGHDVQFVEQGVIMKKASEVLP